MDPTRLSLALEAWQERRAELQAHSQQLEAALTMYAKGEAPLPAELRDQVHALRRECDLLFDAVVSAARDQQDPAGKDGDAGSG